MGISAQRYFYSHCSIFFYDKNKKKSESCRLTKNGNTASLYHYVLFTYDVVGQKKAPSIYKEAHYFTQKRRRTVMKRSLVIIMCVSLVAGTAFGEEKQALTTQKEKLSYAIGIDMGTSLKKNAIDVDPNIVYKGIKDALSGGTRLMTDQELKDTIQTAQKELMAKQQQKMKDLAEKNKKEGEEFLAANKKKPGVKTLPSGSRSIKSLQRERARCPRQQIR